MRYARDRHRVLDDEPVDDRHRAHLAEWHRLGARAAEAAPRFLLQPGQPLVVENYRFFHGREPYRDTQRYFHRALAFTDMSLMSLRAPHPAPSVQA